MDVGGHTRSHPILSSLGARARRGGDRGRAGRSRDRSPVVGRRCSPTRTVGAGSITGIREVELLRRLGLDGALVTQSRHRDARLRSASGAAADAAASPALGGSATRSGARIGAAMAAGADASPSARVRRRLSGRRDAIGRRGHDGPAVVRVEPDLERHQYPDQLAVVGGVTLAVQPQRLIAGSSLRNMPRAASESSAVSDMRRSPGCVRVHTPNGRPKPCLVLAMISRREKIRASRACRTRAARHRAS